MNTACWGTLRGVAPVIQLCNTWRRAGERVERSMTRRTRIFATVACLFVPALAIAQLEGLHVFVAGNVISASQVNENFETLKTTLDAVEARHIAASIEVDVDDCEQLNSELEALASKTIAPNATVTY